MIHSDTYPEQPTPYRVLLVDDHPAIRMGLSALIDGESDLEICGEAEDVAQAMEAIQSLNPDVVMIDLTLENSSGLELIKDMRAQGYDTPVLVLSMHDEMLFAERTLRAGAQGYLTKSTAMPEVLLALRKVLNGDIYLSSQMTERFLRRSFKRGEEVDHPLSLLTDRELEIFQMIGQGYDRRSIATALNISVKTVETHRSHLIEKLQLKNVTELNRHALYWCLGSMPRQSS